MAKLGRDGLDDNFQNPSQWRALKAVILTYGINGRFSRIGGEHGHQLEMTFVNVLPTQNPTLEPFKISFRRVLP